MPAPSLVEYPPPSSMVCGGRSPRLTTTGRKPSTPSSSGASETVTELKTPASRRRCSSLATRPPPLRPGEPHQLAGGDVEGGLHGVVFVVHDHAPRPHRRVGVAAVVQ